MKNSVRHKKEAALKQLEAQLVTGTKPVKGKKPQKIGENGKPEMEKKPGGLMGPVLLDKIPLDKQDTVRINKEITNLKTKLKLL